MTKPAPPAGAAHAFSLGYGLIGPIPALPSQPASVHLSIAVLPFVLAAGGDAFVADALTDDLITHLSRISALRVIGRSSMFTFRDKQTDPRSVGRDLGVEYVVAGTVRLACGRVVVNVELVTAQDGVQAWGERIELADDDWLSASDFAARRIARSLNLELLDVASRDRAHSAARGRHAVHLAMRGWVELFAKPQTAESNRAASQWLNEAMTIDASLALAWTGLAYAAYRAASFGWQDGSLQEGFRRAVALAERAIDFDPRAADAYYAMGQSLNGLDELERAQAAHEACLALSPSHAPAYAGLAQVRMFLGHPEQTPAMCERAFQLSPREPLRAVWHRTKGLAALLVHDTASASAEAEAAIALNAQYPSAYVVLAVAAHRLGDHARAASAIEMLRSVPRFRTVAQVREFHQRPRRARYSAMLEGVLRDLAAAGLP